MNAKPVFINLKLAEFMPLFRTELSFNKIFKTVMTVYLETNTLIENSSFQTKCVDINECSSEPCGENAFCINRYNKN